MNQIAYNLRHARHLRASSAEDRRRFHRFAAEGLMVRLGDRILDIQDVSLGGLRVERQDVPKGKMVELQLIPRSGRALALNDSVRARAEVVGHCDRWTHLRFQQVTYTLAKTIIRQFARTTGVQPFVFK